MTQAGSSPSPTPASASTSTASIAAPARVAAVTLNGKVDDGTGNPITNGKLFIKLNAPVIEDEGGTLHVRYPMEPQAIDITNGTFTASLIPSEETTYNFRLAYIHPIVRYLLASGEVWHGAYHKHTDQLFYTGKTHDANSQRLTEDHLDELRDITNFDAHILPSYGNPVDWAQLVNSGISAKNVDTSILYLSHLLKSDPTFAGSVASGLVRFRGNYSSSDSYKFGEEVLFSGDKWVWNKQTPGNTQPSDSNTDWLKLTGTGTAMSLVDTAYPTGWDGVVDKPVTADKMHDIIVTLAPLENPTFTGTVLIPDGATGNARAAVNNHMMVNYVSQALAGYSGNLLDTPFGVSWDTVTSKAPTADKLYDAISERAPLSNPQFATPIQIPDRAIGSEGYAVNDRSMSSFVNTAIQAAIAGLGGGSAPSPVMDVTIVTEQSPAGDWAGNSVTGMNIRQLEFKSGDYEQQVTVSKPVVTIPPGRWFLIGMAASYQVEKHRLIIDRSDTNVTVANGMTGFSKFDASTVTNVYDFVFGCVNNASPVPLRLKSWHGAGASGGLGQAAGLAGDGTPEIFAALILLKMWEYV